MDYEEKYKQALERAEKLQKTCDSQAVIGWCEYIFPELRESEDERIRKEIAEFIYISAFKPKDIKKKEKWLTWLEKQGGNPAPINVDKMVMEYGQTKDGDFGLPVNCQIRAYRQGINDTISILNLEKQGGQKPADMIELKD